MPTNLTLTPFDTSKAHIFMEMTITNPKDIVYSVTGILDTGAPRTEFSDHFLVHTGFIQIPSEPVSLKSGLQTQKYNKIVLPSMVICAYQIYFFEVFVSYFEPTWGIDALIGLDFFRRFRVTIDYFNGVLLTALYDSA